MARVAAIVPDLFFASKVKETLTAAGYEVIVGAEAPASGADVLVVDLDAAGTAVEAPAGTPRLGFYSHVDAETRRRAEEAGFDLVVPRSRMAREMPELVARLLASAG
jgi:hypothetical protein